MVESRDRKTALVFGATGLTGRALTGLLLDDHRYARVVVFTRRPLRQNHSKLETIVNDLKEPESIAGKIQGNDVFCCLGTTMKKAGSKEAFRTVDLELPVKLAEIAHTNGVGKFLVISSIGADPDSRNFYLKTKGEMEKELEKFNFRQLSIFRPSLLIGKRDEFRLGEAIGKFFYTLFSFLFIGPVKKYKGVNVRKLAKAMVKAANDDSGSRIYLTNEILEMGR